MAVAEESTSVLVDRVLGLMDDASATGGSAASTLGARVPSAGRVGPSATRPAPAPTGPVTPSPTVILRPNGEAYHVRDLLGKQDVEVLRQARLRGLSVLLYGPPGTGKTALVEAAFDPKTPTVVTPAGAATASTETQAQETVPIITKPVPELFTLTGTGNTNVLDFLGGYVQLPDGTYEWVDGPLVRAMEGDGERGRALFIDEVMLIDTKVMAVVYSAMDGRGEITITANPRRGTVKARPGFYVCGAGNPKAPGARMSEALVSRFGLQFEVLTDYDLARELGVNSRAVTAALNMQKKTVKFEMSWAPQLRELINFREVELAFGTQMACNNMISCAPEIDRVTAADVLGRAMAMSVKELRLE